MQSNVKSIPNNRYGEREVRLILANMYDTNPWVELIFEN